VIRAVPLRATIFLVVAVSILGSSVCGNPEDVARVL